MRMVGSCIVTTPRVITYRVVGRLVKPGIHGFLPRQRVLAAGYLMSSRQTISNSVTSCLPVIREKSRKGQKPRPFYHPIIYPKIFPKRWAPEQEPMSRLEQLPKVPTPY